MRKESIIEIKRLIFRKAALIDAEALYPEPL